MLKKITQVRRRPVLVDQKEAHNIDFRVLGLSHSVVKEAEHLRVQELVQRIESHPHREALQADLQQNNVCNPFSNNSKAMIRELGNVELFEFCETTPKVQCSQCLLHWNHGARHGKTEVPREYHMAWNAWKRCCEKADSEGEHFTGIHDRFLRDPVYRESQLAIGWSEQKCKEYDELAKEDHIYKLTPEEKRRYKGQWYLTLFKAGKNGPMKLRSGYRATVLMKNRLHHESGEPIEEPKVNEDEYYKDKKSSPKITSPAPELTNTQDGNIGLLLQVPRGGTHLNGVGSELTFFLLRSLFVTVGFVYS